jgi:hypothetical protein
MEQQQQPAGQLPGGLANTHEAAMSLLRGAAGALDAVIEHVGVQRAAGNVNADTACAVTAIVIINLRIVCWQGAG